MITPRLKPIRIGIFFDQNLDVGGGHQQALNAALLTKQLPPELALPIFFTNIKANITILAVHGVHAFYVKTSRIRDICLSFRKLLTHPRILSLWTHYFGLNHFETNFSDHDIDLVYFVSPTARASDLESINYIITVWDLCHLDYPEFPEVRNFRVFERREKLFRSVLPKSVAIICDSTLGKENLIRSYGLNKNRIHILNFSPAVGITDFLISAEKDILSISKKYNLDCPYIYYPAQFWSHKNHVYVLEGLVALQKEYGHTVGAIFSGGDRGNLNYIKFKAKALGLESRVRFVGFIPNNEVPQFYLQSLAMVMPTYFGPTNLPPLEAFTLGVPVLYPNEPGLRDQVGNAAILIDLKDPLTMAKGLALLIEKPSMRQALAANAKVILQGNSEKVGLDTLVGIIEKFQIIRACWK